MAKINYWSALGIVNEEPVLMKIDETHVMARTILVVPPNYKGDENTYLPIAAFNKKAHVLCALAHRGSTIFAEGRIISKTKTTSEQGKTLIATTFKITDFDVINKEPLNVVDKDFAEVVQMYDPDNYMEDKSHEGEEND